MSTLMKLLTIPAMVIAFSVGVALAASGGSSEPTAQVAPATSTDDTTSTIDTTTGTTTTEDRNDDRGDDAREPGEEVRGPCDEAEHANDPRCTGVGADDRDDNSGPDNAEDDDRGEDRADNSGPGNADDDDDDNGGHGGDDRSGHSGGNDD